MLPDVQEIRIHFYNFLKIFFSYFVLEMAAAIAWSAWVAWVRLPGFVCLASLR